MIYLPLCYRRNDIIVVTQNSTLPISVCRSQESDFEIVTREARYENVYPLPDASGTLQLMTISGFTYVYEAGTIQDVVFQIGARHTPDSMQVESFAVVLFFELADGTRVEVAKIDNSEHRDGTIHIDRYYREVGTEDKDFDVDIDDCWEAEDFLKDNWEHYAHTYLQNHGKKPRTD